MRRFKVNATIAPQFEQPKECIIEGSFSFGHYDAAFSYAAKFLPDYDVIPGGLSYNINTRKFEAINHKIGYGADIWVTEI